LQKAKAAAAVMETRATIRKPAIALGLMAKESFPVSQVGKGGGGGGGGVAANC